MKRKKTLVILLFCFILLFFLSACEQQQGSQKTVPSNTNKKEKPVVTKRRMPRFELENADGALFKSEALEGQVTLIIFFPPACNSCISMLIKMEQLHQTFKGKNFTAVAIASGEISNTNFSNLAKKINLSFPLLLDSDSTLYKKFAENPILPIFFIVSPQGIIEKDFVGHPSHTILKEYIEKIL